MPDKPLTVFTYAASASLAAVALVYFFHPSYLFDSDTSASFAVARKNGIVGLYNPANDCFINCVLQSLAGLGDLRVFLIREVHRRELVSSEVYENVPARDADGRPLNVEKLRSLQGGLVTKGLKSMIDHLNEKPLYPKTISAMPFTRVLEHAFGSTISKAQQDAQEFLQLIAQRLSEEYHAGAKARERFFEMPEKGNLASTAKEYTEGSERQEEDGFSLEGKTETRVECGHCHFVPKAKPTSFVMLNLMVPHQGSTTLNDCFDAHFKREFIDDYKCDKCRLTHALELLKAQLRKAKPENEQFVIQSDIDKIEIALRDNPEKLPQGLVLPDIKQAPRRKISKHVEITSFPKVLVIHLSRSIFDPRSYSMKNSARVTFPERFPIGGILNRRNYKLLGVITHKGTHSSGHYESFRRQHVYAPYSNPHKDRASGPYSAHASPMPSPSWSPSIQPASDQSAGGGVTATTTESEIDAHSPTSARTSGTDSRPSTQPSTAPEDDAEENADPANAEPPKSSHHAAQIEEATSSADLYLLPLSNSHSGPRRGSTKSSSSRLRRRKKPADRWWRISDDRVKECETAEVLSMTREVYMLFYGME